MTTRKKQRRDSGKTKSIILTGPRETESFMPKGDHMRESTNGVGSTEQREGPTGAFIGRWGVGQKNKCKEISSVHLSVIWLQLGKGRKENLWQRPTLCLPLAHLVTWEGCSQPVYEAVEAAEKHGVLKVTVQIVLASVYKIILMIYYRLSGVLMLPLPKTTS